MAKNIIENEAQLQEKWALAQQGLKAYHSAVRRRKQAEAKASEIFQSQIDIYAHSNPGLADLLKDLRSKMSHERASEAKRGDTSDLENQLKKAGLDDAGWEEIEGALSARASARGLAEVEDLLCSPPLRPFLTEREGKSYADLTQSEKEAFYTLSANFNFAPRASLNSIAPDSDEDRFYYGDDWEEDLIDSSEQRASHSNAVESKRPASPVAEVSQTEDHFIKVMQSITPGGAVYEYLEKEAPKYLEKEMPISAKSDAQKEMSSDQKQSLEDILSLCRKAAPIAEKSKMFLDHYESDVTQYGGHYISQETKAYYEQLQESIKAFVEENVRTDGLSKATRLPEKIQKNIKEQVDPTGLYSLMMAPIQRAMRYRMMFKEMTQRSPQILEERPGVIPIVQFLKDTVDPWTDRINAAGKEVEQPLKRGSRSSTGSRSSRASLLDAVSELMGRRGLAPARLVLPFAKDMNTNQRQEVEKNIKGVEGTKLSKLGMQDWWAGRTRYVVKNPDTKRVFAVNVIDAHVTMKPIVGQPLSNGDIQFMHSFIQKLSQSQVTEERKLPRIEGIERSCELKTLVSLLERGAYRLGKKEKKHVREAAQQAYQQTQVDFSPTYQNEKLQTLVVRVPKGEPGKESVHHAFQRLIDQGFIPECKDGALSARQGDRPDAKITITTQNPLLAIKQIESVISAGLSVTVSRGTRARLKAYGKAALRHSDKEEAMTIDVPADVGNQSQEVLRRVKEAAEVGLLFRLTPEAREVLQEEVFKKAKERRSERASLEVEASALRDAPSALKMAQLLTSIGLEPNQTQDKSVLRALQRQTNKTPIDIKTDNWQRDLQIMRKLYTLGICSRVHTPPSFKIAEAIAEDAASKEIGLPYEVPLGKVEPRHQINEAQKLAMMGLYGDINVPVPPETKITLGSREPEVAIASFQRYLNKGLLPEWSEPTETKVASYLRGLGENSLKASIISLEGLKESNAKRLWAAAQSTVAAGLVPRLSDPQISALQNYLITQQTQLPVSGYRWQTVEENLKLAHVLGVPATISEKGRQAYLAYVADLKVNSGSAAKRAMVTVAPIMQTPGQEFTPQAVDLEKTERLLNNLISGGIPVDMRSPEIKALRTYALSNIPQKSFFGLLGPTKVQRECEQFLTSFHTLEERSKEIASEIEDKSADELRAVRPLSIVSQKSNASPQSEVHFAFGLHKSHSEGEAERKGEVEAVIVAFQEHAARGMGEASAEWNQQLLKIVEMLRPLQKLEQREPAQAVRALKHVLDKVQSSEDYLPSVKKVAQNQLERLQTSPKPQARF